MARKRTLNDVARRAGVSLSTVSRIAGGTSVVSAGIEERVRSAAAELAVPLEPRQTLKMLAFLLGNRTVLHPIHSRILYGAQNCCRSRRWDLLFVSCDYAPDANTKALHLPQVLFRKNIIRGVILAGTNHPNLLASLEERRIAYSVYGNNVTGDWDLAGRDVVFADDLRGAVELTNYVISLGHRKIRYIGDCTLPWFCRTRRGYETAMSKAGLEPQVTSLHSGEREVGYLGAKAVLRDRDRPTAIIAGTDATAEGVYRAVRDMGLSVPGDISVAGINDTEARLLHPPLTTVRCFPEEVGAELVGSLLRRIEDPKAEPRAVTIPSRLIKQESCAPPPQAGILRSSVAALNPLLSRDQRERS